MGRARAAARVSIRLRLPPHARPRTVGMKTPAFHVPRVSRTIRRLQSPSHKRQGGDAACSMQDVTIAIVISVGANFGMANALAPLGECALGMRGRRRRPETRHGTRDTGRPAAARACQSGRGVSAPPRIASRCRDRRPTRPDRTATRRVSGERGQSLRRAALTRTPLL